MLNDPVAGFYSLVESASTIVARQDQDTPSSGKAFLEVRMNGVLAMVRSLITGNTGQSAKR